MYWFFWKVTRKKKLLNFITRGGSWEVLLPFLKNFFFVIHLLDFHMYWFSEKVTRKKKLLNFITRGGSWEVLLPFLKNFFFVIHLLDFHMYWFSEKVTRKKKLLNFIPRDPWQLLLPFLKNFFFPCIDGFTTLWFLISLWLSSHRQRIQESISPHWKLQYQFCDPCHSHQFSLEEHSYNSNQVGLALFAVPSHMWIFHRNYYTFSDKSPLETLTSF